MKRVLVVLAVLVGIVAVATACGASLSSTAGSSAADRSLANPGQSAPSLKAGQPPTGTSVANPTTDVVPPVQGPQVIRQAQLTISVASGSFDSKLADVRALVQLEQGFISGTDAQSNPVTNDQIRTGVISFMVPADKFDQTIDQLTKFGKVQTEHISGNDVSAQYVDLQARLKNQEAQRDAMLALLQQAKSIGDIIAVQTQLGQITGQIEQLKGQIAYIDHNTTYSTVTVNLMEAGAPVSTAPADSWGFASALSDAAHNFVTTVNYLITGLGAAGPILVLVGLGFLVWRRRGWPMARHA